MLRDSELHVFGSSYIKDKSKKLKTVDRYIIIMVEKSRNNLSIAKADEKNISSMNSHVGMLSKSRGQILRVAAVLHVLFHLDTPLNIFQKQYLTKQSWLHRTLLNSATSIRPF